MDQLLLRARGVTLSYGKIEAVRGVDLDVEAGRIVTVIGPNGAGKTSLLAALMGVFPASGEVTFLGRRIDRLGIEERVGIGLGLVPEKRELFAAMEVEDNLILGAFAHTRFMNDALEEDRAKVYELFPRLKERARQRAGTLSGGERQMLALGRALMGRPKLLMLDEPSLGLSPILVKETFKTVVALRERGVSILLVEQNARAALSIADYAYVLEHGQVALQGPARELATNPRVIETYLGLAKG